MLFLLEDLQRLDLEPQGSFRGEIHPAGAAKDA